VSVSPRFSFVPVSGHELHVTEWGNPDGKPLVMWHGLARTGRDFDELAAALADEHFVICPDTIGRGLSSWSKAPDIEYSVEYYAQIAGELLDHYAIESAGWLGTSMGGLIGMRMASGRQARRISYLIINDIGPEIPQPAIDRILTYATELPSFNSLSDAEKWLRSVYVPFGPASDRFWQRMTRNSVRRLPDGDFTIHYDPNILVQFTASVDELTTWDRYEQITAPTYVTCGEQSDILPKDILERMMATGPKPQATLFNDCGHAPSLSRPADISEVRRVISTLTRRKA